MSTGQFSLTDAQPVPAAGGKGRFRLADAQPAGAGGGSDASGVKGAPGSPQLHADMPSSHAGGMAREAALGFTSSLSGLPESTNPIGQAADTSMKGDLGFQIGQHIGGDPNAPSAWEMMKQHNPLSQAIDTGKSLYGSGKEMLTGGSPEEQAHGAGSFVGQLLQLSSLMKMGNKAATPEVSAAARAAERHAAINQGQVKVVNGMVKTPIEMLDAKVTAEVGKHVDAVLQADELHNKITNNPAGYVNSVDAAATATKASEKIGGEFAARVGKLIERANAGPMTMREAKALTTDVGRENAAMMRSGKTREASVLSELYNGLHEATANRADDLGQPFAKSWQHYIDETRSYKDMKGGLLGDLQNEPNHAKVLDKLTHPDNAASLVEITKKMKQYGVDPKPLMEGKRIGGDLNSLSQETKNAFVGKIRSIMKYPLEAGAGAAGASVVGHLSGIPGMGFVLPLIVAGKIGGMLDAKAIKGILADVQKKVPAGMGNVHEPGAGPMPAPAIPSGEGITPPGAPKEATPGEVDDMAEAQQGEESRQAMARKVSRAKRSKKP